MSTFWANCFVLSDNYKEPGGEKREISQPNYNRLLQMKILLEVRIDIRKQECDESF